MKIGMMWFNNNPNATFQEKVGGAVSYYEARYGKKATLVMVHPSTAITDIDGITIKTSRSVLPNHLWVGQEDS